MTYTPIGQNLSGVITFLLLASLPIALLLSWFVRRHYVRSVLRSMMSHAESTGAQDADIVQPLSPQPKPRQRLQFTTITPDVAVKSTIPGDRLMQQNRRARRRLAYLYAIAGAVHAAIIVFWIFHLEGIEFLPQRTLAVWLIVLWPTGLALMSIGVANRRFKRVVPIIFLLLPIMIAPTHAAGLAGLWGVYLLIPTLIILLLANRHTRATGPILLLLVAIVIGSLVSWPFVVNEVITTLGLWAPTFVSIILALAATVAIVYFLRRFAFRYQRKKMSDQMLYLDAWWLLFTIWMSSLLVSAWGLAGLRLFLAFLAFKIVLWMGYPLLFHTDDDTKPAPLLLLRVFGFQQRAETLLDEIGAHWRHLGPINLIAGTDLASAYMEPHEFLNLITGRLSRAYVKDKEDLGQRMELLDTERDPDGRFRVNEFFCHDNTWKMTLQRLVQYSQAVLMDLRGFSPENQGCIFELAQLLNLAPLQSVVLMIDDSTDEPFLRTTMTELWELSLASDSPNRALAEPTVQLVYAANQSPKNVDSLLRLLTNYSVN